MLPLVQAQPAPPHGQALSVAVKLVTPPHLVPRSLYVSFVQVIIWIYQQRRIQSLLQHLGLVYLKLKVTFIVAASSDTQLELERRSDG